MAVQIVVTLPDHDMPFPSLVQKVLKYMKDSVEMNAFKETALIKSIKKNKKLNAIYTYGGTISLFLFPEVML